MCEQNTLSKLYGNLLQTSSLWHRADRGTTRSARDPSSHTPAGAPQDDNVFLAGGFAPCTPIRNCEHSCLTIFVQFDILFFHKQVCQQSEPLGARAEVSKSKSTILACSDKRAYLRRAVINCKTQFYNWLMN